MKLRFMALLGALLLSGCVFEAFDDSDQMVAADKTVTAENVTRVTTHLLNQVPAIRAEKAKLVTDKEKVKLTLSILSAPEPGYTKNDPDYRYHADYYWVYVNYRTKEKLLKHDTYLVHKDLADIYFCDADDKFVKVSPGK